LFEIMSPTSLQVPISTWKKHCPDNSFIKIHYTIFLPQNAQK
jgi:hypothetical protein